MMRRLALALLVATAGCSSFKPVPAHPAAAGRPVPGYSNVASFVVGDRVIDQTNAKVQGTVTQAIDTGHHWGASGLRVDWDDGDYTTWQDGAYAALSIVWFAPRP